jgi:hypothetical protein
VLSGQNELDEILRREDLRQFKQRVAYRFAIQPLSAEEVEHYIQHRWTKAGGIQHHPFTDETVTLIARYSRGIPRVVNTISDNALLAAFGSEVHLVEKQHVLEAVSDLDLAPGPAGRILSGLVSTRAVPQAVKPNGQEPSAPVPEETEPAETQGAWPWSRPTRPKKEKIIRLGL